jgi:tetratricopeptide (TPR) repeat protein
MLLGAGALRGAAVAAAAKDPLAAATAAVVKIICKTGDGRTTFATGFVWGRTRQVVTALHAVEGAASIDLYYQTAKVTRAGHLRAVLSRSDLALLDADQPPAVSGLEVAHTPPQPGDALTALGFPLDIQALNSVEVKVRRIGGSKLEDLVSPDVRSDFADFGYPALDEEMLNLEAPLQPGHSGAPIVTADGLVVGIGEGGLGRGTTPQTWAIPAARLAGLAASQERLPAPADRAKRRRRIPAQFSAELEGRYATSLADRFVSDKRIDPRDASRPAPQPFPERASELAAQIADSDPLDARILKAIAEGRFAEARRLLDEARKQADAGAYDRLTGDTWYYEGKYGEALGWYQKALGRDPDDADAQDNVAVCLVALHRPRESLSYFNTTVVSYKLLASRTGETKWSVGHAQALINRGLTLRSLLRYDEASADFAKAANVRSELIERQGHTELENDLAEALVLHGIALDALGRYDEALAEYRRAIQIRIRLVEREHRTELAGDLAHAFHNRANTFVHLKRYEEALRDYSEAVETWGRLVEQAARDADLADDLAAALKNRGNTFYRLARYPEALADQGRAVELTSRLVDKEGHAELADRLAGDLLARGTTLESLQQFAEALRDFDRAAAMLTRLVEKEGRTELANNLAVTLNNRGNTLNSMKRCGDAVGDFDRVIEIRSRLVEREGHAELAADLATALSNRGNCLSQLNRNDEALRDHSRAVAVLARLVEQEGRSELAEDLAAALANRAGILWSLGRNDDALRDCNQAIDLRTRLVEREGRTELANELAKSLITRGMVLEDQGGDLRRAEADFQRAGQIATDPHFKEIASRLLETLRAQLHRTAPPPRRVPRSDLIVFVLEQERWRPRSAEKLHDRRDRGGRVLFHQPVSRAGYDHLLDVGGGGAHDDAHRRA